MAELLPRLEKDNDVEGIYLERIVRFMIVRPYHVLFSIFPIIYHVETSLYFFGQFIQLLSMKRWSILNLKLKLNIH